MTKKNRKKKLNKRLVLNKFFLSLLGMKKKLMILDLVGLQLKLKIDIKKTLN